MAINRLNLYRKFVERIPTNDALYKQTILEGLDAVIEAAASAQQWVEVNDGSRFTAGGMEHAILKSKGNAQRQLKERGQQAIRMEMVEPPALDGKVGNYLGRGELNRYTGGKWKALVAGA
jgi:hypothetical protein